MVGRSSSIHLRISTPDTAACSPIAASTEITTPGFGSGSFSFGISTCHHSSNMHVNVDVAATAMCQQRAALVHFDEIKRSQNVHLCFAVRTIQAALLKLSENTVRLDPLIRARTLRMGSMYGLMRRGAVETRCPSMRAACSLLRPSPLCSSSVRIYVSHECTNMDTHHCASTHTVRQQNDVDEYEKNSLNIDTCMSAFRHLYEHFAQRRHDVSRIATAQAPNGAHCQLSDLKNLII